MITVPCLLHLVTSTLGDVPDTRAASVELTGLVTKAKQNVESELVSSLVTSLAHLERLGHENVLEDWVLQDGITGADQTRDAL